MAKIRGNVSALYMQTAAVSAAVTGGALSRVGTTLWYVVTSASNYYWDKAKAIVVYDGVTEVTPLEIDYAGGAVRLATAAVGSVTADFYKFACSQLGGFRSFSLDENMEMIECTCFEDIGEVYEPGAYSASGSGEGFWTSVDSSYNFNGLTLKSRLMGDAGDAISAECLVAGNNTALTVTVASQKITINSATSGAGAATSKNWEIRNAIEASAAAAALVTCKYTTDYATDANTVMGAIAEAHLAGGMLLEIFSSGSYDTYTTDLGTDDKNLTFQAITVGDQSANPITVQCVVSGENTVLDVTVSDTDITIVSGTSLMGFATSTAAQIREKINGDAEAKLLIVAKDAPNSDATAIMGAFSPVTLVGGNAITTQLRWGEDLVAVFYWDSGAALYRTSGLIQLEKLSLKAGVKGLVGKTLGFKSQGLLYDAAG